MKKFSFLLLASFLVLSACGNEESKSDDKKETKSLDKESKKDDKKKDENKEKRKDESDKNSNEEVATQDKDSNQSAQSQQQTNTQEQQTSQQPNQTQEQTPVVDEQNGFTSGPTEENPANLNPSEEQNTNMDGEHVVSPGWTQDEQSAAYEEYKKGKQAQAAAGPSAVPGAGLMDLD
ncbi:hypothetical protein NGB28_05140 [Staphylococcus xylosus]|uniref:hypothetical protein n=1 Tax=Staphylococcus TaxID=1279 RepID=UPI002DBE93F1|nr:hypothetical protein [Staphylococcus xylosus]MEB7659541.1 hypothetical protein [Staphylococcus xylosus]MEB7709513.1 hypothetical protein [Staphylococcus xylosus]MEB7785312.1 hypothetical protein [Staphylococcus xylosus]